MTKIAIIQEPPVVQDRAATLARAVEQLEAAGSWAELVVFPETYVPGYPAWIWRLRPGEDAPQTRELHARLVANAVRVDHGDLAPLCDAAARHGVTVVVGFHELEENFGRSTLYNALAIIGPNGAILNRHRKLRPTNPERMVWGLGDATGLKVIDTPIGRLGALICWENFMPHSRFALYAQGVEIYCAPTYDFGDGWIGSMQHIAREGRCYVLSAGCLLRASDLPADLPARDRLYPDPQEWINDGDSVVIAPGGRIIAGPLRRETGMLLADLDLSVAALSRRSLDVTGHYARPDIFQLSVDRRPRAPVVFED